MPLEPNMKTADQVLTADASAALKALISRYKRIIQAQGFRNELYKWELVMQHKDKLDTSAGDFATKLISVLGNNMFYKMSIATAKEMATKIPQEYRQCYVDLFNENQPLAQRIVTFKSAVDALYHSLGYDKPSHHDERTIANMLTFHDPTKYTFFKDSYYQKYCKLINVEPEGVGGKYPHYLSLMKDLIDNYINSDAELIELVDSKLSDKSYKDPNHMILAQDILYQALDYPPTDDPPIIKVGEEMQVPLNTILYGPPGTGKTYNSINMALQIADPVFMSDKSLGRADITNRYRQLVEEGRIVFTTFHQSMSYEDFIEGIKPITNDNDGGISYDIEPGIFKRICTRAALPDENNFDKAYTSLTESLTNMDEPLELKTQTGSVFGISLNSKENLSLHTGNPLVKRATLTKDKLMTLITGIGIPAFYKGYYQGVINHMKKEHGLVVGSIDNEMDNSLDASNHDDIKHVKSGKIELGRSELFDLAYQQLITDIQSHIDRGNRYMFDTKAGAKHEATKINSNGSIQIKRLNANQSAYPVLRERLKDLFIQFPDAENLTIKEHNLFMRKSIHQGASNAPTYIAILLRLNKISNTILSSNSAKVGTAIITTPHKDKQDSAPPQTSPTNYVLIIDEINRGNVSQIFGELITLIEPDKRAGMPEALEVTLPYSKDKFSVPANLYIIGTMNTADRSVEALDTALRRRFSFREMAPEYDLLKGSDYKGISLKSLLEKINLRIEGLLDKDHAIGHSYFLKVSKKECTLKTVFFNEIIPLLQEYFYGNFGRIELVLGSGFVKSTPVDLSVFALPSSDNDDFSDHMRYTLVRSMNDDDFLNALHTLMN
jgi:5-methylcytosine-specific restriction protein B